MHRPLCNAASEHVPVGACAMCILRAWCLLQSAWDMLSVGVCVCSDRSRAFHVVAYDGYCEAMRVQSWEPLKVANAMWTKWCARWAEPHSASHNHAPGANAQDQPRLCPRPCCGLGADGVALAPSIRWYWPLWCCGIAPGGWRWCQARRCGGRGL